MLNQFLVVGTGGGNLDGTPENGNFRNINEVYRPGYMLRRILLKLNGATGFEVLLKDGDDEYELFKQTGLTVTTVVIADMAIPVHQDEHLIIKTSGGGINPKAKVSVTTIDDTV